MIDGRKEKHGKDGEPNPSPKVFLSQGLGPDNSRQRLVVYRRRFNGIGRGALGGSAVRVMVAYG